jgi:hypothetical protein
VQKRENTIGKCASPKQSATGKRKAMPETPAKRLH